MIVEELPELKEVRYGSKKIAYTHLRMERQTIEVAVHPDCSVTVKSPLEVTDEYLESRVKNRARWILRQWNYFKQFQPSPTKKHYVSGESHLYLGRKYRLKVTMGKETSVQLKQGKFIVESQRDLTAGEIQKLMEKWYRKKAKEHYEKLLSEYWLIFQNDRYKKPTLSIRLMKTRWGSLSTNGVLTLNLDLIKAPKECIEYVIIHELCHLVHANHSDEFYSLLEKRLPDWEKRKHKLELNLMH